MEGDKNIFYISGSKEACEEYFHRNKRNFKIPFSEVYSLLTNGLTYHLYVSENFNEAAELGECVYKMSVEKRLIDSLDSLIKERGYHYSAPDSTVVLLTGEGA